MPKFTDSPYFLLNDYFNSVSVESETIARPEDIRYTWIIPFTSIVIDGGYTLEESSVSLEESDLDGNLFANWTNTWNIEIINRYEAATVGSYLVGPECNIVTIGGGLQDLYVKDTNTDMEFIPITVKFLENVDNDFNFWNHGPNVYIPSDTISGIISGGYFDEVDSVYKVSYKFIQYDNDLEDTFNILDNGSEVYFRKDSTYHDWVKSGAGNYYASTWSDDIKIRNYFNYDTQFSYFGNIYKTRDGEYCTIKFNGMKDFAINSIPIHQRSPKFTEFLITYFDRVYQENYNLLKNVFTLIDPYEIDIKYLGYLSQNFNMFDVPVTTNDEISREFIANMPWLLKRKGTYSELYVIWRVLAATTNRLNVYEKWHDKNLTGTVPVSAYEEYIYVDKPEYSDIHTHPTDGAGKGWYEGSYPCSIDEYVDINKVLSTQYRIEMDINNKPLSNTEIFSKEVWSNLYKYWEYLRPINRVADYRILFSPRTNLSGFNFSLYDKSTIAHCYSKSIADSTLLEQGADIHTNIVVPSDTWVFSHNLNSPNVIVQVIDENMIGITPKNIERVDSNNIIISFDTPVLGYALLKEADVYTTSNGETHWSITHLRNKKEVVIQYRTANDYINGVETVLIDVDTAEATSNDDNNTAMVLSGNYVAIQSYPSKVWTLPHTLNKKGVIVSIYDETDTQIQPLTYTLISSGEIEIEFDVPVTGYVVMTLVGSLSLEDKTSEFESSIQSSSWSIGGTVGDISNGRELTSGDVDRIYSDNDFYYLDIKLPIDDEYTINEIEIYGYGTNPIFYTECSNVYKPSGIDLTIHYRILKDFENV